MVCRPKAFSFQVAPNPHHRSKSRIGREVQTQKHVSAKTKISMKLVERRPNKMRKIVVKGFLMVVAVCFLVSPVSAVKPGEELNPNGFPSGPHYNLNIIGKNTNFVCPEQEYVLVVVKDNNDDEDFGAVVEDCDEGDVCEEKAIYGNVIFVPEGEATEEGGAPFDIYMESGRGKKAADIPELQVTDPCGMDGKATLQLPKCDAGYRVYARALGKPTGEPYYKILSNPQLNMVQDDAGNYLIYLGELNDNGVVTSDEDSKFISRKKGKSRAKTITELFEWTGWVCAFPEENETGTTDICWIDGNGDTDVNYGDQFAMPDDGVCPDSAYTLMTNALICTEYEEPTWMFNVAEFVECIWGLDNHGMKLLQIRFYPN
jgi:hypothetical protein